MENTEPQLEEIVALEPDALNDEQKTFLNEQKDNLTDEQAEKFGIEKTPETPAEPEVPKPEARFEEKEPPVTPRKGNKVPDSDEDEDIDDDEVDENDKKLIAAQVAKELARRGITGASEATIQDIKDTNDVDNYIRENPDYGKYRQSMLTYIKHSAYKNIPVKNIAAIVSANDAQLIGAKKEREAQAAVAATKGGGTSVRPVEGGVKDWTKATKEEMDAKTAEVLGRNI